MKTTTATSATTGRRSRSAGLDASSRWNRAWRRVFGLVFALTEKRTHHRVTPAQQVWTLCLHVVAALQVLAMALSPTLGWHRGATAWVRHLLIRHMLFNQATESQQQAVVLATAGGVLLMATHAAYCDFLVASPTATRTWPLTLLRAALRLSSTALFVPIVGVLLAPFDCGEAMLCGGSLPVWLLQLAAATGLVLFVPMTGVACLLGHESDANAAEVDAKVGGEESLAGCVAALALCVATVLPQDATTIASLVLFVLFAYVAAIYTLRLPYFNSGMNRLAVCVQAAVAAAMLGVLVLAAWGTVDTLWFTVAWQSVVLLTAVGGALLPSLRYRKLNRKLASIRGKMLMELQEHHTMVSQRWYEGPKAAKSKPAGPPRGPRRAIDTRRANITKLAVRAHDTRSRAAALPLGEEDKEVFSDKFDHGADNKTCFDGMSAYEAELIVRMELALPGNTDKHRRRRRFGRSTGPVPTTQAVEHAVWLFAEAMNEFTEDAVDIARIKIEQARFLQVYTADVNMATAALEAAQRERPTLEGQYQIFARLRRLVVKRKSQNADEGRDGNELVMLDYSKRLGVAMHAHGKAISAMSDLFKIIAKHHTRLTTAGDSMAERLGSKIESMGRAKRDAQEQYARLLASDPTAPYLAEIYAGFCRDVLSDPALGAQFYTETSAAGHADTSSTATPSMADVSRPGASLRKYRPKSATQQVSGMDARFQAGTFMLLLLAGAMFASTSSLVSQATADVQQIVEAGQLRYYTTDAALASRHVSLLRKAGRPTSIYANETLDGMGTYKGLLNHVFEFFHGGPIALRWDVRSITARTYSVNDTWYDTTTDLWEAANLVADDTSAYIANPASGPYHDDKRWRFTIDNAVTQVIPALEELVTLLENDVFAIETTYEYVQVGLLAFLGITLLYLGFGVFMTALRRVQAIKRSVNLVAAEIPPLNIGTIVRRTRAAQAFLRSMKSRVAAVISEGVEDRGMGNVDGFTYDEEVDRERPAEDGETGGAAVDKPVPDRGALISHGKPPISIVYSKSNTMTSGDDGATVDDDNDNDDDDDDDASLSGAESAVAEGKGSDEEVSTPPHPPPTGGAGSTSGSDAASSPPRFAVPSRMETSIHAAAFSPVPGPVGRGVTHPDLDLMVEAEDERHSASTIASSSRAASVPASASTLDGDSDTKDATVVAMPAVGHEPDADDAGEPRCPVTRRSSSGGCPFSGKAGGTGTAGAGGCTAARTIVLTRGRSGDKAVGPPSPSKSALKRGGLRKRSKAGVAQRSKKASVGFAVEEEEGEGPSLCPEVSSIVDTCPCAVVVADSIGTILYVNSAFTDLMGFTPEDAVGGNVTMFQPPEIASNHADIMKRVVDGGVPRAIGKAGRQFRAVHKDGTEIAILLGLQRIDLDGDIFFVADMSDLSVFLKEGSGGNEVEQEEEAETARKSDALAVRVTLALALVLALQVTNSLIGMTNLIKVTQHASEVNNAGKLHFLTHLSAFACREAIIGDGELWSSAEAAAQLRIRLDEFHFVRYALRYGDEGLRLPGSAGRNPAQDALQFGTVTVGDEVFEGLDSMITNFEADADSCVRVFQYPVHSVGANLTAIEEVHEWDKLEEVAYGRLGVLIEDSVDLYMEEVESRSQDVIVTSIAVTTVNGVMLLALYLLVFRRMVVTLTAQARRSEVFLAVLPDELAARVPLSKHYLRRRD